MDPTVELILQLLVNGTALYTQWQQASAANDQASLDAIQAKVVAASNALAPAGSEPPVLVG